MAGRLACFGRRIKRLKGAGLLRLDTALLRAASLPGCVSGSVLASRPLFQMTYYPGAVALHAVYTPLI